MGNIVSISTIGQDSHRFGEPAGDTTIKLGGIDIPFDKPILANSDGDVVYHAITNAISGFTGVNILGGEADKICLEKGIKDSAVYLNKALEYLKDGKISAGHARALLSLENEEDMKELADLIVSKDLSVRQTEKLCKKSTKTKKEAKAEKKPSFYSMVELALNESLGRKISITKNKGKQGGVLQIEFYSDEELTELSNKLK